MWAILNRSVISENTNAVMNTTLKKVSAIPGEWIELRRLHAMEIMQAITSMILKIPLGVLRKFRCSTIFSLCQLTFVSQKMMGIGLYLRSVTSLRMEIWWKNYQYNALLSFWYQQSSSSPMYTYAQLLFSIQLHCWLTEKQGMNILNWLLLFVEVYVLNLQFTTCTALVLISELNVSPLIVPVN